MFDRQMLRKYFPIHVSLDKSKGRDYMCYKLEGRIIELLPWGISTNSTCMISSAATTYTTQCVGF